MLRSFTTTKRLLHSSTIARADIVRDLYLIELKKYSPQISTSTDLKDTFSFPHPPQKPTLEKPTLATASPSADSAIDSEWPKLSNPIDDPKNYSDEFEWEKDDGSFYPKRRYPVDYDHHH